MTPNPETLLFRLSIDAGEWLKTCWALGDHFTGVDLFGASLDISPSSIDALILESPETRQRAIAFGRKYCELYDDDRPEWLQ